ncbi:hypothetical protein MRO13_05495 [Vibrio metschnikovii]|uniref:HTH-like domain-containing protein n=1 Tax=Vibrio metschnikovii TaxID=28172 RepID=UPI000BCD5E9E|nr:MAG: hypothetical protein B7X50_11270 [Alishewanella sp. 34-51-39]
MDKYKLGQVLSEMYENAKHGESVAMIHLFGIKYADEIRKAETTATELANLAKISPAYATEISKGMKLSKYVKVI